MNKVCRVVTPLRIVAILSVTCMNSVDATEDWRWQVRPIFGLSSLSDVSGDVSGAFTGGGDADVSVDSGFLAGLGLGYRVNDRWVAELAWEYRSNDSSVVLTQAASRVDFNDGDYASNVFHFNGIYNWPSSHKLQPYVGVGLSWVQEVDLDLIQNGQESSFSANGDIGFQAFGGLNWAFNENWGLHTELRYGVVSGVELEAEESNTGTITGLDYTPVTIQLGLIYRF